jgi:hypothetical protein
LAATLGPFSTALFPALRLGYPVVPPALVDAFTAARALTDRHPPSVTQALLADFIADGPLARPIRRTRALHAERQAALVAAAARGLAGALRVAPSEAGMHPVGWLPPGADDRAASAAAAGVDVPPLAALRARRAAARSSPRCRPPGLPQNAVDRRPRARPRVLRARVLVALVQALAGELRAVRRRILLARLLVAPDPIRIQGHALRRREDDLSASVLVQHVDVDRVTDRAPGHQQQDADGQ